MPAYARKIDPETGDVVFDDDTRTWTSATTPELAVVQNVLRTRLGSAARDRTFGVEPVDQDLPNAGARWRQNVLVALRRWITSGFLRDVEVNSEVRRFPQGNALFYTVSFKGRDGRRQSTPQTRI
jgi:hypothetical protein